MADLEEDFSGNDKHYKVLRKALKEKNMALWNEFATSAGPYFRADLRGMDLSGQDLTGAQLRGARLEKTNFDRANLSAADLTDASLTGASLRDAILEGTRLKVETRVKVRRTVAIDPTQLDPEARRHRKLEQQRTQAVAFLEESKKKELALAAQKARVKAKNTPSPFTNTSR